MQGFCETDSLGLDRHLRKVRRRTCKTRFKSVFKTDKRNHCIIKLENNSLFIRGSSAVDGKRSEERKLARVSIVKCSAKTAQCVSIADSRSLVEG